jgi:hypothetical protein
LKAKLKWTRHQRQGSQIFLEAMNQNEEIYTKLPQNIPNDAKLFRTCRKTKYVSKPLLKLMASRGEARGLKNWRQKSFAACGYCSQMFARILPLFFSPSFAAFQKNKKKKSFLFPQFLSNQF